MIRLRKSNVWKSLSVGSFIRSKSCLEHLLFIISGLIRSGHDDDDDDHDDHDASLDELQMDTDTAPCQAPRDTAH